MNILLVAATQFEIAPFTKQKPSIDVLLTGVGMPVALYHLQKKLSDYPYDLVIQAGIAGAFSNEFELGETVLVKQDCFGDLGIEENGLFTPLFETELLHKNDFPFEEGWLKNKNKLLLQSTLELVKGVTVSKVSNNKNVIEQLISIFNPEIETMEGAALHYVCLQQTIPFIQLRSISNYVGERDKTKWQIDLAIENLTIELLKLINELSLQ
jgi:futalosine hydrolase